MNQLKLELSKKELFDAKLNDSNKSRDSCTQML